MKKNIKTLLLFLLMIVGIFSCEKFPVKRYDLLIKNNSHTNVCCYFYLVWDGGDNGVVYPDTLLSFDREDLQCINIGEEYRTSRSGIPITEWVASQPKDTLSIFIFSKDTLERYYWENIQQNCNILKRYDLSIEDMEKLSVTKSTTIIPYPPTEAMKKMKMYPPYGQ